MSAAAEEDEVVLCASCGTAGSDGIKLKNCTACYLVRYCSVKCQKDHRPRHKKECKKRAAELRDELLFKQPESSYLGDCPICCLPLHLDPEKSFFMSCCSKSICDGCSYGNQKRAIDRRLQEAECPFCRKALPSTKDVLMKQLMKRIEVNDPVAMCHTGKKRYEEGDYTAAFEYWSKAAALGDVEAHNQLSLLYHKGEGVEKDEKKALHHLEQAAIGGHQEARHNLGCVEAEPGTYDRSAKHFIIAAKLGHEKSLEEVKTLYTAGYVSKDDFAAALRGYKAAIDALKSPNREKAAAFAVALAERRRAPTRR